MILAALTTAAVLTLSDWEEKLKTNFYVKMYYIDLEHAKLADENNNTNQFIKSEWWCNTETAATEVITDLEKMIIMEDGLTPHDIKILKVIQLNWKLKEAEAHKHCLGYSY